MVHEEAAASRDGSEILDCWSARKVQPVVLLYLLVVFAVFIAMASFIFHSSDAVKALLMAAVGAVAATVPGIMSKVEYRATPSGIERRTLNEKKPGEFTKVFRWDDLSHVKRTSHGFKFYLEVDEASPARRFWKLHISDECSGEIHVEKRDLDLVLRIVEEREITIS